MMRNEMPAIAQQAWQMRKSQFSTKRQVIADLGLPRRAVPVRTPAPPTSAQAKAVPAKSSPSWDAFISHASADKETFVKPLAGALTARGLKVWYDNETIKVGDSLREKIDEGLSRSRFGIVVLSPAFFARSWPQKELNGLAAREVNGVKVILPVWHNMNHNDVLAVSPMLADRLGVSSYLAMDDVVSQLIDAMGFQVVGKQ